MGIKMLFPPALLAGVPTPKYERVVLECHDMSFAEQYYLQRSWAVVVETVPGERTRKRVYNAAHAGWRQARPEIQCGGAPEGDLPSPEETLKRWIEGTVSRLAQESQGEPEWFLPKDAAA